MPAFSIAAFKKIRIAVDVSSPKLENSVSACFLTVSSMRICNVAILHLQWICIMIVSHKQCESNDNLPYAMSQAKHRRYQPSGACSRKAEYRCCFIGRLKGQGRRHPVRLTLTEEASCSLLLSMIDSQQH